MPIARIDVIDAIALRGMRLRWKEVELAVQGRMHSALTSAGRGVAPAENRTIITESQFRLAASG